MPKTTGEVGYEVSILYDKDAPCVVQTEDGLIHAIKSIEYEDESGTTFIKVEEF